MEKDLLEEAENILKMAGILRCSTPSTKKALLNYLKQDATGGVPEEKTGDLQLCLFDYNASA